MQHYLFLQIRLKIFLVWNFTLKLRTLNPFNTPVTQQTTINLYCPTIKSSWIQLSVSFFSPTKYLLLIFLVFACWACDNWDSIMIFYIPSIKWDFQLTTDLKTFKYLPHHFVFFSINSLKLVNILSWRNWETGFNYL